MSLKYETASEPLHISTPTLTQVIEDLRAKLALLTQEAKRLSDKVPRS